MIPVSDAWKKAHTQRLLPETFVEITMDVANQGFAATITGENVAPFSNTILLLDNRFREKTQSYAFLEQNLWLLDGSRDIYADPSAVLGFVGNDDQPCKLTIKALSLCINNRQSLTHRLCIYQAKGFSKRRHYKDIVLPIQVQ